MCKVKKIRRKWEWKTAEINAWVEHTLTGKSVGTGVRRRRIVFPSSTFTHPKGPIQIIQWSIWRENNISVSHSLKLVYRNRSMEFDRFCDWSVIESGFGFCINRFQGSAELRIFYIWVNNTPQWYKDLSLPILFS